MKERNDTGKEDEDMMKETRNGREKGTCEMKEERKA